ncbi:MAG: hypothetical protein K0S47_2960 [Herbinix sp.]|jgi:integral membrane protein (TIGR01906 family)|nr:hypothetical protein [Herbinix sp.]
MKYLKRFKITDFVIGIVFTLLFISIGVVITINFRPLYYMDVNLLNIEAESGYEKEEILNNYNALIDYSSPFFKGELKFPTLPASEQGIQHFREVKNIFTAFYILGAITIPISIGIIIYKIKQRDYSYLLVSSITAVVLPTIVGLLLMINFDAAFHRFHTLFFNNDYWIFDPALDPVILILPENFFMHCAVFIIFIVVLCSVIQYLFYRKCKKYIGIQYRKNKGLKL